MRRDTGPIFSPDAAKATDATVDRAARDEAAQGLIRGHAVREAACDALIRTAECADEGDTGSQLPSDVVEDARDAMRIGRKALGAARSGSEPADEAADREPSSRQTATEAADDTAHPGTQTQTAGQSSKPRGDGRRHADAGGSKGALMREGRAGAGSGGVNPGQSTWRIGMRHARASETAATSGPTKLIVRTKAPHPPTQTARRTHRVIAARRTVTGGARAAIASGATAGASASGGAVAAGSGGAGIVAAPIAAIVLLLLLFVVLLGGLLGGGAVEEDQTRGAHRLAQTATDEYLAGESRGDYNHKGLAYSAFVRGVHGGRDGWDICFVGWCMARAGFVDAGLTHAYGDAGSYVAHFRFNPEFGEVHDRGAGDYAPVEGDLFVSWQSDGTQHIGIVTSCDGTRFETVEGDVAGGPNGTYDWDEEDGCGGYVACRTRLLGRYSYTFIHPYYSDEAVTGR